VRATTKRATKRRPRGTGTTRQLPSQRWQATFTSPDGERVNAPKTFETKLDAAAWLTAQARDVAADRWERPAEKVKTQTLGEYAETWLAGRELKPRTRYQYRRLLDDLVIPHLGKVTLDRLSPTTVRTWHAALAPGAPTWRAQGYSLLRAICTTAVADELIDANPCRVRGAGKVKTKHEPKPATLAELTVIVDAVPARYRAMMLLAAWCGLRFGELTELRRRDVDVTKGKIRVERGVVLVEGERLVGSPKSDAGKRTVSIPPHLLPALEEHLDKHVGRNADALLFPARGGGHMAPSALYKVFYPAREKAGRPDLRFHDLRHTGATLAAATGATLADLMQRLGHSTPGAAMRYQHAAEDRDQLIADALSGFAAAGTVTLKAVK
jgi:integrase